MERLLLVAAVAVLVVVATAVWRRREGRLQEADGRLLPEDLGLPRRGRRSATIVEFTGAGCGPCGPLRERLEAMASEIGDVDVVTIDAGDRLDLAERYDVRRVPTVLIADERLRIRWRASGVPSDPELRLALLGPEWAGRPHPDPVDEARGADETDRGW